MADKEVNTEKYSGPGRVMSSLGYAGILGAVVTAAGRGVDVLRKAPMTVYGISKGTIVANGIATVVGLIAGYKIASHGKQQFDAIKGQRDTMMMQAGSLSVQNQALQAETGAYRKQFTNTIQSRSETGHAAAALVDKANAMETAR